MNRVVLLSSGGEFTHRLGEIHVLPRLAGPAQRPPRRPDVLLRHGHAGERACALQLEQRGGEPVRLPPFRRGADPPTEAIANPLRFAGRELDGSSELYYHEARWYDPSLHRFVSEDPIGIEGGINLYSYVENDPVNAADPSGLFWTRCVIGTTNCGGWGTPWWLMNTMQAMRRCVDVLRCPTYDGFVPSTAPSGSLESVP